jgi:hypothetical protein
LLACCGAANHPWDREDVEHRWLPRALRCFIIGENPGDTTSEYFYHPPSDYNSDTVVVRRTLLRGLHLHGLIPEATLEGFHDAGFLFDHAIRCQLSPEVVGVERRRAMRYASRRVENPAHLQRWLTEAAVVWVMGHLASNAVANATSDFPRVKRLISRPPYPGPIGRGSRFFVSEYLTWRTEAQASRFCEAFRRFASAKKQRRGKALRQ